jgi:hypothetical protein
LSIPEESRSETEVFVGKVMVLAHHLVPGLEGVSGTPGSRGGRILVIQLGDGGGINKALDPDSV